jgi:hypothetical protein
MYTVYLLNKDDYYKIGFTRKDPMQRIKQLNTGSTSAISLVYVFTTKYPSKLEASLHRKYKQKKAFGEWYRLSHQDVCNFLKECNNLTHIFETLNENPYWQKELSKLKNVNKQ